MDKIRDYSEIAEKNKGKVDIDDLIFGEEPIKASEK